MEEIRLSRIKEISYYIFALVSVAAILFLWRGSRERAPQTVGFPPIQIQQAQGTIITDDGKYELLNQLDKAASGSSVNSKAKLDILRELGTNSALSLSADDKLKLLQNINH